MIDASFVANTTVFDRYCAEFERLQASQSQLQFKRGQMRGQIWQPRYIAHDYHVLGRWVCRVSRSGYEVAFMEFKDYSRLPPGSALKAVLLFMLSDAYFGSGSMSVRFRGPRQGATPTLQTGFMDGIPQAIVTLARSYGINLASSQAIPDIEGRELYIHLTGVANLSGPSVVDPFHAALVCNRGIWKKAQIEGLCQFALAPEALLIGENNQRYGFGLPEQHDKQVLLYLLMREHIERILKRLDSNPYRVLTTERETDLLSYVTFSISDSLEFPNSLGAPLVLNAGGRISVRLFPWHLLTIEAELGKYLKEELHQSSRQIPLVLVFPLDVRSITPGLWSNLEQVCTRPFTACFILEDSHSDLKREVRDRLTRSSTTLRAGPGIVDD